MFWSSLGIRDRRQYMYPKNFFLLFKTSEIVPILVHIYLLDQKFCLVFMGHNIIVEQSNFNGILESFIIVDQITEIIIGNNDSFLSFQTSEIDLILVHVYLLDQKFRLWASKDEKLFQSWSVNSFFSWRSKPFNSRIIESFFDFAALIFLFSSFKKIFEKKITELLRGDLVWLTQFL